MDPEETPEQDQVDDGVDDGGELDLGRVLADAAAQYLPESSLDAFNEAVGQGADLSEWLGAVIEHAAPHSDWGKRAAASPQATRFTQLQEGYTRGTNSEAQDQEYRKLHREREREEQAPSSVQLPPAPINDGRFARLQQGYAEGTLSEADERAYRAEHAARSR